MNPDWLHKHNDQISEAPDAVPRLRRFILDLAVRGKLVDQDPAEDSGLDLLKTVRIIVGECHGVGQDVWNDAACS